MTSPAITESKVWTEKTLEIFDYLRTPIWVFDFDENNKWWANRSGLALWKASSNHEFRERGRGSFLSEATKLHLASLRARLERGELGAARWTFYPQGHDPFVADGLYRHIYIDMEDGGPKHSAMFVEAHPVDTDERTPNERRGLEVLRHTTEMISLYKSNGELLMRNMAAIAALGEVPTDTTGIDSFADVFVSAFDAPSVRSLLENGPVRGTYEIRTKNGFAWHVLDARITNDPVTGNSAVLVNHRDITERIRAEHALAENREKLAFQTEQLRRLAASPLRVWKGILALPLIGRIDEARIVAGLEGIQTRSALEEIKVVLLDLTGAELVDADAAESIRRLIRSLALQGIGSRVVGVRATLARTLVGEGIDLGNVPLHASLADALAMELRR